MNVTSPGEPIQRTSSYAKPLAILVVLVLLTLAGFWWLEKAAQAQREREAQERRNEAFQQIKTGGDGRMISILDSEFIAMLARDAECVANLETLNFFMADIADVRPGDAKRLANVKFVRFYSTQGVDEYLAAVAGSPNIEEVYFETTLISDEGIKALGELPNLKKVHFFATVVRSRQKELLRKTLPKVKIEIVE